jgi:hypothetical protein
MAELLAGLQPGRGRPDDAQRVQARDFARGVAGRFFPRLRRGREQQA